MKTHKVQKNDHHRNIMVLKRKNQLQSLNVAKAPWFLEPFASQNKTL
jgi:hypothetical protein